MVSKKAHQKNQAVATLDGQFFRLMFEQHVAIMLLEDPQSGTILDGNQAAARFYGYSLSKLRGMSINTIKPLPQEQVELDRQNALKGKQNFFVLPHKLANGEVRMVEVHSTAIVLEGKPVLFSIIHDISDRIQAEQKLLQSELFYRSLFDMLNGIAYCRMLFEAGKPTDFIYLMVNKAFEEQTGLKDACGKKVSDLIPGVRENSPELFEIYGRVALTGVSERFESFVDGLQMWFSVSVYSPAAEHFVAVFDAITEKKQLEKVVSEDEERFREVLENSLDASYKRNLLTNAYDYFSPVITKISGYTPAEMKSLPTETVLGLMHPDDIPEVERVIAGSLAGAAGEAYQVDYRFKHKDGQFRWFHDQFTVVRDTQGQPDARIGSVQDITERKRVEDALVESEKKHRRLFETMAQGVIYYGVAGEIISANPAVERILGLSLDQLRGKTFINPNWKLIREDGSELSAAEHPVSVAMRTGRQIDHVTIGIFNPNQNTHLWLSVSVIPIFHGGEEKPYQVYSTFEDITQRKIAEDTLQESEERLQLTLAGAEMGLWNLNLKTMQGSIDARSAQILGYTQDGIPTSKMGWDGLTHPEDVRLIEEKLVAHLEGRLPVFETEHRMRHASGEYRWVSGRGKITHYDKDGAPCEISGTILDITQRKQAEAALRDSESKLRAILDNSQDAIGVHINGIWEMCNPAMLRLFGVRAPDELIGKTILNVIAPQERDRIRAYVRNRAVGGDAPSSYVTRGLRGDGTEFDIDVTLSTFNLNGKQNALVILRDITERLRVEDVLRESEKRFRHMADTTPAMVWQAGTDGMCDYFNKPWLEFTGRTLDQEVGKGWTDGIHPEDFQNCLDTYLNAFNKREKFSIEYRMRSFDGKYHWLLDTGVPRFTPDGIFLGYIGSCIDIHSLKELEKEIQTQRDFATQIINMMGQGLTVSDSNGQFEFVNPAYAALLGYQSADLIGKHPKEFTVAEDQDLLAEQRILRQAGKITTYESHLQRADGGIAPVLITGVPRKPGSDGISNGSIAVITDLSEQKHIESELRQAKELLERALAREQELSHTDELTGVHNRRSLFELADGNVAIASRYKQPLAVLMFDIDHFKQVNDIFGHDIGDLTLEKVTQAARAELRSVDVIGRYGGEEFIILLPMTTAQQAFPVAERIRTGVESVKVATNQGSISVTVSIGIVEINHDSAGDTVEDIFRRADRAMYSAKFTGRNRTVIFDSK